MHDDEQPKKVMMMMNGPRPSPLMINRDSHLIRKPPLIQKQHHQKGPVIIYTQSPKIIHTKPQDFMALVQRLTGRDTKQTTSTTSSTTTTTAPHPHGRFLGSSSSSFSDEEDKSRKSIITTNTVIKKEEKMQHGGATASTTDDHEITSSALIRSRDDDDDDDHEMTITCGIKGGGGGANSILNFADMPLFTPTNSYDFFCSPSRRPLYKFSDSSPYGILGSLISPSGLGFIKDLPEY